MSSVVIGEAVALELRPARLPSRMLAAAADLSIQLGAFLALIVLVGRLTAGLDSAASAASALVLVIAVAVGYPVLFETLWRGRTPGKALLGLRVVRDDGGPVGFRQALVRGLVGVFVERPGITLFVAGVVTSLASRQGKRLGDVLAGTFVQQERVPAAPPSVAPMPAPLAGWAATLDLSRLPDDLALAARQLLSRMGELTPAAREELGGRLVRAVAAVVSPPPPPGTPGWAYLAAVLAERRRRAELRLTPPATGSTATAPRPPIDGPRGVVPPPPAGAFAPPS